MVHRFTHRHGYGSVLAQLPVARHVFGGQGFFQPGQIERRKGGGAAHHLRAVEALVGVGHDLKARPHCGTHRRQPRHVFAHMRSPDLDLGPLEALGFRIERLRHQFVHT